MEIKGTVHCFFEQSGTFKNEFIKLGIPAEDWDIQNNFGQTDHTNDLFAEIETAYSGGVSCFDSMNEDDLIIAFFPCIYFCAMSQIAFNWNYRNYKRLTFKQRSDEILKRMEQREYFFAKAVKMLTVAKDRGLRLIMENPWGEQTYLKANFVAPPTIVDKNRRLRGDYFVKPTAYWFINCEPTKGFTPYTNSVKKTTKKSKSSPQAGLCSEERSLMTPEYACNFIHDFILGKSKTMSQLNIFEWC